jgi:hypothetical protein
MTRAPCKARATARGVDVHGLLAGDDLDPSLDLRNGLVLDSVASGAARGKLTSGILSGCVYCAGSKVWVSSARQLGACRAGGVVRRWLVAGVDLVEETHAAGRKLLAKHGLGKAVPSTDAACTCATRGRESLGPRRASPAGLRGQATAVACRQSLSVSAKQWWIFPAKNAHRRHSFAGTLTRNMFGEDSLITQPARFKMLSGMCRVGEFLLSSRRDIAPKCHRFVHAYIPITNLST